MKKILVVDDEIGVFMSIKMALSGNCQVTPAYTGAEAIEQFKKERPDLILLDLRMPDIDGLDILHIIRKLDSNTPVIVITAYPEDLKDVSLDELNIISCFVKPFDLNELTKNINKIWGGER
ncbi:MAG: response regulator [Candidatus Omnitrophota bacterium]|nr:MAG: response regulator [Candidatus Omnitrophota bacterium]